MAFEPLRTDEKLDTPPPPERDIDSQMIAGCSGFVGASLITYGLSVWPFFAFTQTHLVADLVWAGLIGLVSSLVFGAYVTRRYGLAAACGFVGGGLTTGVFLFLRLTTEYQTRQGSPDLQHPEYPASWVWIVPTIWVLATLVVTVLFLKRSEIDVRGDQPAS